MTDGRPPDAGGAGGDTTDRLAEIRRTMEGLIGVPATERNELQILRNGDRIFAAMLAAIRRAAHTIDFLTFIYWTGDVAVDFARELSAAARRGVRVRVLLDSVGARLMDRGLVAAMTDAGCDVRWFRPVDGDKALQVNHRTHRKVLICDEIVSFTGGVGIAGEWQGDARDETEWRDTHFRIRGPATNGLRAAFIDNWAETDGTLLDDDVDRFPSQPQDGEVTIQVVRGAAETGWSEIATMFRVMIHLARERLRITTAYFTPDDVMERCLVDAARRGVEVDVLVPGPHIDKRLIRVASEASWDDLLEAGVRIHEFQPSMLHAKVMTVDGLASVVGSANVNSRSTVHDEEVDLVVFDPDVTAELDTHFDDDLARSEPVDPARWAERSALQRAREAVVDVFGDLL